MSTPSREEINQRLLNEIDVAIERAAAFQSMTVDGEQTVNSNIGTLMRARELLLQEEAQKTRVRFATFDVSQQDL